MNKKSNQKSFWKWVYNGLSKYVRKLPKVLISPVVEMLSAVFTIIVGPIIVATHTSGVYSYLAIIGVLMLALLLHTHSAYRVIEKGENMFNTGDSR